MCSLIELIISIFLLILLFYSLTPSLLSDSSDVRAAGLRAIRHCIQQPVDVITLVGLRLTILICR